MSPDEFDWPPPSTPEPLTADTILAAIRTFTTNVRFGQIVANESHRTVVCNPADLDKAQEAVIGQGLGDVITVVTSPLAPVGQAFIIDEQAVDAAMREESQQWWGRTCR